MKNEIKSTAPSKYRYKFHIVFAPQYRRKRVYKELRTDYVQQLKSEIIVYRRTSMI